MKEENVYQKMGEVLEFTRNLDIDPQERIVVLKSATMVLENMLASEALMQTMMKLQGGL